MTEADLEQLAKRYLALWQEHLSSLAADPAFAASMRRLYAFLGDQGPDAEQQQDDGGVHERTSTEAGTAAVADAPHGGRLAVEQLALRLADVERRLAELESGAGPRRRSPEKGSRRRRS